MQEFLGCFANNFPFTSKRRNFLLYCCSASKFKLGQATLANINAKTRQAIFKTGLPFP